MKTFRVLRAYDEGKLHGELVAAGIPVVTVRSDHAKLGEVAAYGVVVTSRDLSGQEVAILNTTIAAHVESRVPSRAFTAQERNNSLDKMEQL